ncbi:MAG: prepilin peptidase [Clostridia bacterium]|nr:prepilin peptidase [Clostridia bacterium]
MPESRDLSAGGCPPAEDSRRPYPYVQSGAVFAAVAALLFVFRGFNAGSVFSAATLGVLLSASVQDLMTRKVSNRTVASLFLCGFFGLAEPSGLLIRAASSAFFFLPFYAVYRWGRDLAPGGADVKIAAALGFALGFRACCAAMLFTLAFCILFIIISLAVAAAGKAKPAAGARVPLVPFFFAGTAVACLII